jgi:acyl carrier protein phosphodiesterase
MAARRNSPDSCGPDTVNWLAHVFLSERNVEFRLGNLLADVVRGQQRESMSADFLRGVRCHQSIDAFTDAHAIVRRSRSRLDERYRRFSGVLVDIFFDYFLATHWDRYSATPLEAFTASFYSDAGTAPIELPAQAQAMVDRIIQHDLLGAYREVRGVERSLRRLSAYLSSRWNRPFALEQAVAELLAHEAELAGDFNEFFPQLHTHVAATHISPQDR